MKPEIKSGILDIAAYKQGKSAAPVGKQLMKLSSNENALGYSPAALEAYQQEASNLNRYPDGSAAMLKKAIHEVLGFEPERVVCGAGSDEIIHFLINAFAREGDEVLQCQYGFLMYQIYAKAAGATPVFAPAKNLVTDVDALLGAVTKRTKLVFVANPNNPTGTYLNASELQRLRAGLPEHVVLVVDEAYVEYADAKDYQTAEALVRSTENTVLMRTFSKAYGLPGLRIGFGFMPAYMADALNRIRGPFNLTNPSIAAGAAAMRDQQFIQKSVAHNAHWRGWLSEKLTSKGYQVVPSQGNFLLVKCGVQGLAAASSVNARLTEQGIIVRETANYGLPEYLRITIGTEAEMQAVASNM